METCCCKQCTKRNVGCHSICDDYKEYRMNLSEKNRKERLMKQLDALHRR